MDRIEIPEDGRIAAWVEAVERGDEVVIVRDGTAVAEVRPVKTQVRPPLIDLEKLAGVHASLGELRGGGAALIRALRDEERF